MKHMLLVLTSIPDGEAVMYLQSMVGVTILPQNYTKPIMVN